MDKNFQHALVLLEQQRYDLAEEKLRQSLATTPEQGFTHALLAHCLCERQQWDEATEEARQAIHFAPDLGAAHAALARVLAERNRFDEAENAIREALRLEPDHPDHWSRLASIHLARREWQAALEAAEQGLSQDPEHIACANLHAMALVKLGRGDEAGRNIAAALARAPEDAFSHANQGWTLLHQGERQKALEHFREALRLDPGMEFARMGIVEALKAKNWLYRVMLHYFLWMSRLGRGMQWVIVLGGYFGYRALTQVAVQHPNLAPWIRPVLVVYIVFAVMTWIASPLFNLLLRFDKFGRHALSRDQVVASNWVAGLLAPALILAVAWLVTDNSLALFGAITCGLLLLPVSAVFHCQAGWPRRMMALYTLFLAILPIAFLPLVIFGFSDLGGLALQAFLWGCILSGFVANFLVMQTPRR
jgi:tetratricopeptide (TPR) repeat protein